MENTILYLKLKIRIKRKETMKIKNILFYQIILLTMYTTTIHTEEIGDTWHFNTKILRDKKATKIKLLEEGFQEVTFQTEDGYTLTGLFLERPNAKATISFFHGFCPGGKEGFAPFVKIAPQDYNLLFVDMRGYGDSQGPSFLPNLKNYGRDDYKDVECAAEFVKEKTKGKPQVIFGWCSGAFNTTTALLKMKEKMVGEKTKDEDLNIKGLVFDSGFGSIIQISKSPLHHVKNKFIPGLFAPLYGGNRKKANKSILCRFTSYCLSVFLHVAGLFILPPIIKREPKTNLFDKIQKTDKTPILVVHAEDDKYAPWEKQSKLVDKMPQKTLWLIEKGKSSHAENHLKVKNEYKRKMGTWLANTLNTQTA